MSSQSQTNSPANNRTSEKSSWRTAPSPIPEDQIARTLTADIAIVGYGYAGLSITRTAAEAGASVIAAEAMPRDKWWTVGHDIASLNSDFAAKHGIPKIDPVEFANNWMVQMQGKANMHFTMTFAKESGEMLDWFLKPVSQENLDKAVFTYFPENEYTIHQLNNGYRYYPGTAQWWEDNQSGKGMVNNGKGAEAKNLSWDNQAYIEKELPNAQVLFGTKACQLIFENGRAAGFIAKDAEGSYIKILGTRAVVLCGGGFAKNSRMCEDLLPQIHRTFSPGERFLGIMGRDGSAIQMGVWAGGRLETDIGTMNFDSMVIPDYIPGPLWVNEQGKRFQNEAFAGPELNGFIGARLLRGKVISIYDSNYSNQILRGFPSHQAFDYSSDLEVGRMKANFEAAKESSPVPTRKGFCCADTLDGLADAIGFDSEAKQNFLNEIAHYNELCASGLDTDYGKDSRFMNGVKDGPFYAHVTTPKLGFALCTVGGFVTTNDQQVLDENYQPIPGLYASGNTCGLRFGSSYNTPMPGLSIGMALTLGRHLGKHLSAI